MEEERKTIQIFKPIVRWKLPFKALMLTWEEGKGTKLGWEPAVFEFPPPFLTLTLRRPKK